MSGAGDDSDIVDDPPYVVEAGPAGTRFLEVRRFVEIDSTNRYLLDVARRADQAALVAVAEHQSAGRGRLGRRWEAPSGASLLVSVLVRPGLPTGQLHLCTAAVALSAADACFEVAGLDVSLKWPNDLMVVHRKLAGILAESVPSFGNAGQASDSGRSVVVGLGLNVLWPGPDDAEEISGGTGAGADANSVPHDLRQGATSIVRETGIGHRPEHFLNATLSAFDSRLQLLGSHDGRLSVASEYRARCDTVGQDVLVQLADGEVRGIATDVTPEGHLVVDQGACFTTISAGDVVHVRRD